jgi:hypothetical protein
MRLVDATAPGQQYDVFGTYDVALLVADERSAADVVMLGLSRWASDGFLWLRRLGIWIPGVATSIAGIAGIPRRREVEPWSPPTSGNPAFGVKVNSGGAVESKSILTDVWKVSLK